MNAPRIGIIGAKFFCRRLEEMLKAYSPRELRVEHAGVPDDGLRGLLRVSSGADVLLRVGMRPGAAKPRGVAFDTLWSFLRSRNPKARTVFYWIGTDVMDALNDARGSRHTRFFRKSIADTHIAGAPWLVDELDSIGIKARTVLVPGPLPEVAEVRPMPVRFNVLSYVPETRHAFYGSDVIYNLAVDFPAIDFNIIGGRGDWCPEPRPNLHFHGYVNDTGPYYSGASLVLRLVPHDGMGGTVIEALIHARHVLFTYKVPHTHHVSLSDYSALVTTISNLYEMHSAGSLGTNISGREYALARWNVHAVTSHLVEAIL